MIPLFVIDALIKDFKEITKYDPLIDPIKNYLRTVIIPHLEEIKKEAIPSPEPVGKKELEWMDKIPDQGLRLEQKIKNRIKELKPQLGDKNWYGLVEMENRARIDELRKLLK